VSTKVACARAGCAGSIESGYCDVCGSPPAVLSPSSAASPAPTTSGRPRRGLLIAGLVEVPPVPESDPASAVLSDPNVPEDKRYCGKCEQRVGRGEYGRPGRLLGFCSECGTAYDFTPKLAEGDLLGGQYEVVGCLGHGGVGWIYLARDRNVSDRWVVLKGLINSGDADAVAVAMAERRFLAAVEHPNIVEIHNFVEHDGYGYIVMEYVGGRSLKDLAVEARAAAGGLPVPQVLAYGLEILRALGYLHARGLLYCDVKPANVIQTEDRIKIIDLGGVIGVDDTVSPVYGTVGYQAPEVADSGPTVSSDLYALARTLAVLAFNFEGYTNRYESSLPERRTVPVLAANESFYRLIRRAADPLPKRRFQSAEEMAEQLTGVLRETLAIEDGTPRPARSTKFGPERAVLSLSADVHEDPAAAAGTLPLPVMDPADPSASYLTSLADSSPAEVIAALTDTHAVRSVETTLRLARAYIEFGAPAAADERLGELHSGEWRVKWYRGLANLAAGRERAYMWFDSVYSLLPGEIAPKLALGLCSESRKLMDPAIDYYGSVWYVDHSYLGGAFGLARCYQARNERRRVVEILDQVPPTSSHHNEAQLASLRARMRDRSGLTWDDLMTCGTRLEALTLDAVSAEMVRVEVLRAALDWLTRDPAGTYGAGNLLGFPLTERGVRFALERAYRSLSRHVDDRRVRNGLIDLANAVRPRTLT
jgi:serine/threonine-protein kinase PknG